MRFTFAVVTRMSISRRAHVGHMVFPVFGDFGFTDQYLQSRMVDTCGAANSCFAKVNPSKSTHTALECAGKKLSVSVHPV